MLISGESYIIDIWTLFLQKKSDVQACLVGIHSDLIPWLVSSLRKREKKGRALNKLTQRGREREKVIEGGWGGKHFPESYHEGSVVFPFLFSLVSQTQSR